MRKTIALLGGGGGARRGGAAGRGRAARRGGDKQHGGKGHDRPGAPCGKTIHRGPDAGYEVIFDGSRRCFERWRYAGGSQITLQRDGTLKAEPGPPNLGVLWYAARPYGDFSLRLQFRDDSPVAGQRANSGVQVRFPAPKPPVPGCPMTFNGSPQTENPAGWIAVNCGHEIQINDSPDGGTNDPRKTGSIYGFADLNATQARVTPAGTWNDLEIKVVGQTYTVIRNGVDDQRVREPAGRAVPRPPQRPGLELTRARRLPRAAVARRAAGRRLVPQHPRARPLGRVARARAAPAMRRGRPRLSRAGDR